MADDKKQFNQNGYLMLNGPDDTLWIPRSSNKSWLTLFYALPRVMVEKQRDIFRYPAAHMMCCEQKSMMN